YVFFSFFFFFFQAEDGIRDYKVTGVQTCALPISSADTPGYRASTCASAKDIFSRSSMSGAAATRRDIRVSIRSRHAIDGADRGACLGRNVGYERAAPKSHRSETGPRRRGAV